MTNLTLALTLQTPITQRDRQVKLKLERTDLNWTNETRDTMHVLEPLPSAVPEIRRGGGGGGPQDSF